MAACSNNSVKPLSGLLDSLDAVLWTPGARNAGMEIAMMLEEVQVSP
tara:strand:- start:122 stop:262 length:141 start_codon:yes stop_codon:yes gene_type:complete